MSVIPAGVARAAQILSPYRADPPMVRAILDDPEFTEEAAQLAAALGRPHEEILAEIRGHLVELSATHQESVLNQWHRLGRWMLRGFDRLVDEEAIAGLRSLDQQYSLAFLISHRSYLDEWAFPGALTELGLRPPYGFAGANLNFFPLGSVAKRTGIVHIRRATSDMPVYKLALRRFMRQLVADRSNMIWSIEGGRSRTGKLRPPRLGLLRYVADAVDAQSGSEVLLVPVSLLYDQLPAHEAELMTAEARGSGKTPEDLTWFYGYLRGLRDRLGRIYVDIGEPIELGARIQQLQQESDESTVIERVAVEVSHHINTATPITPTAAVCIALLAANRALTLDEVVDTVEPLADYLKAKNWPTAGAANLTDRANARRALQDLVRSGVLSSFQGDTTVWSIKPTQHLVAAMYRNSAVHALVERAILEVALVASTGPNPPDVVEYALRLRDILKFEFFFAHREEFLDLLQDELRILAHDEDITLTELSPDRAAAILSDADLLLAPLVLRPFIEAYVVVASGLADLGEMRQVDEAGFIDRCLVRSRQWALQRRNASEESTSAEMFATAIRLAHQMDIFDSAAADIAVRRLAFREETENVHNQIGRLATVVPDTPVRGGSPDANTTTKARK